LTTAQLQQDFETRTAAAKPPQAPRIPADGRIADALEGEPNRLPLDVVPMMNLPFELAERQLSPLLWADARVLFDPLTKTAGLNERENSIKGTVTEGVIRWFRTADKEIKMVSPYFVPSDASVASLAEAQASGVRVALVTNSLASTDEPMSTAFLDELREETREAARDLLRRAIALLRPIDLFRSSALPRQNQSAG